MEQVRRRPALSWRPHIDEVSLERGRRGYKLPVGALVYWDARVAAAQDGLQRLAV